jgi:uncharacterized membrane protein
MKHEWLLKRNCSMSPRQSALAYGALCAGAVVLSLVFAVHGLWFMFAFAALETAGVAAALVQYARHATDHEHIALSDSCLLVERVEAGMVQQVRLDPCWTRIAVPTRTRSLIRLESRGVKVEVGSFVSQEMRQQVAKELRDELRSSSFLC